MNVWIQVRAHVTRDVWTPLEVTSAGPAKKVTMATRTSNVKASDTVQATRQPTHVTKMRSVSVNISGDRSSAR